MAFFVVACYTDGTLISVEEAASSRAVGATYYAGAVTVTWELASDCDRDTFRVYARRSTEVGYHLVAAVTSCQGGVCSYTDTNIQPGNLNLAPPMVVR